MKIFFIGTVNFSREMLNTLLGINSIKIIGIATKSSSKFNSDHTDLSDLAILHGIDYKYVKDINAVHITKWINGLNPDLILCLGWSSLIKKDLLEIPRFGVIGYHPAELPKNRGRHPIIWALVLGLPQTASTFFLMDEGADSGDIISQKIIKIDFEDTSRELYKKLILSAQRQLINVIDDIQNNRLLVVPQKCEFGNVWRKRSKSDGKIDWRMRSLDIYNLVRALNKPYPGAHFDCNGAEIKVWKCMPFDQDNLINIEPGKVLKVDGKTIVVKTGDGAIKLIDHEFSLENIGEYLV